MRRNRTDYQVGPRDLGQVDTKLLERNCSQDACNCPAITALDQQALCLNHFLLQCYTKLEELDPRGQKSPEEPLDLASMRAFIEECSRKALDVSLHSENLSNLERGRLLDILLWAGELFLLLRAPRVVFTESADSAEPRGAKRAATLPS